MDENAQDRSKFTSLEDISKLVKKIVLVKKMLEEVICRINPANSDLFAGLIRQIVSYLPD